MKRIVMVVVAAVVAAATLWLGVRFFSGSEEPNAEGPTAEASTSAEAALPDGEHFGFVTAFDGSSLTMDTAEFLTGDEAQAAAWEDGDLPDGQELPNGFYIRHRDSVHVRLAVAPGFEATLLDNQEVQPRAMDAVELASLVAGEADTSWVYAPLDSIPMTVWVENGLATRADEQYVP